jgi:hypothetical protein
MFSLKVRVGVAVRIKRNDIGGVKYIEVKFVTRYTPDDAVMHRAVVTMPSEF